MQLKSFHIDPALAPELAALARRSIPNIERVVGESADRLEVTWGPTPVSGAVEPAARFVLTDAGVQAHDDFWAEDFADDIRFRRRLREVWRRILLEQTRNIREAIRAGLADGGEE